MNPKADGNVDLILTGALNNKLKLEKEGSESFSVFSDDIKAKKIADKYGLDVYNLNEKEKEMILNEAAAETIIEAFDEIYN